MPPTGALIRGSTGRLQRSYDGTLKRCGCCTEGACLLVVKAYPCTQVLDEDCERQRPEYVWVCTDADCGGEPVGTTEVRTFAVTSATGIFCYHTDPDTAMDFAKLTEEEQSGVYTGPLECVADCGDELCGESDDTCDCTCDAYTTNDLAGDPLPDPLTSFCCLGKHDADGHLCWDWEHSGYEERRLTHVAQRGGPPGYETCNLARGCQADADCIFYRKEIRSKPADSVDICDRGCCLTKQLEARTTISKLASGGDLCGPTGQPGCCDCSNTAAGTWADDGVPLQFCTPNNLGTRTTVIELIPIGDFDGCTTGATRTTVETYTCDSIEITVTDEIWGTWTAGCDGDPPFDCCLCSIKETIVTYAKISFIRPQAGDVECAQCLTALGA